MPANVDHTMTSISLASTSPLAKDDITISGLSGRLPESDSITEFRDNLMNKHDMITDDGRRWTPGLFGLPTRSGKVKDLTKFDATFFGVHPKQADTMDPQIRMLLEVTHEAIVDAGVDPASLRGTNTGVFIGASGSEAREAWSSDPETTSGYSLTGGTVSMFANRVSFAFDLRGPSYVVDTACSSSLLALDHAVHAIRTGLCDTAIVGGTSICIRPNTALQFNRLSMLAPDGTCKSFDASGDGYTRSEAVVAILLQRTCVAKRQYAHVVETGNNCDGFKTQGITYPSGEMQMQLLKSVYASANLDPTKVAYIEAHGTGTKVGDPQEVNTIAEVFCPKSRQGPLYIGSVKSNMGHPEPASGLAALAKVVIALREGVIPPNLHYRTPNTDIPGLSDGRLMVVTEPTPLTGQYAAINSFGFGGSNVHAIMKQPDHVMLTNEPDPSVRLVVYGGRTPVAVEAALESARNNGRDAQYHSLLHQSACQATGAMPHRGYTLVNSRHDNQQPSATESIVSEIQAVPSGVQRPVWYVFSGMGSQWHGMARDLMALDLFRESLLRSDALVRQFQLSIYDMLMGTDESVWNDILNPFVAMAAIQVALVDLLSAVGIRPDGIVGHSVGELGCAYADGCLTAEETVLAAYWRGRCVQEAKLPRGAMAAVGLTWEEAKRRCPDRVVAACHNAVDTITISGPADLVQTFVQVLKKEGVFAKEVSSAGTAFHSYFMESIAPSLNSALQKVINEIRPRTSRWVSSSIPESKWDTELARYSSADYYTNNLVSPVLFQEALHHIPNNAILIEIAPHCLLQSILKRSLGPDCTFTSLMKRGQADNLEYFLTNLGKLYIAGLNVNPLALWAPVTFPVSRSTPMISPVIGWDHSLTWDVPKADVFYKGDGLGGSIFDIDCNPGTADEHLQGHKIDGRVLYPATGYLVLAWKTLAKLTGRLYTQLPVVFEDVAIHRATILPSVGRIQLEVNIMSGSGDFEVLENGSRAASGNIRVLGESVHKFPVQTSPTVDENHGSGFGSTTGHGLVALTSEDVYKELRLRGYDYGATFQGVHCADNHGRYGSLLWRNDWISFLDSMLQMCVLSYTGRSLRLPTRIKSVRVDPITHINYVGEKHKKKVIDCFVDNDLGTISSGAVEILGLHATVAPRRKQQPPTLESFAFLPNDETIPSSHPAEAVKAYVDDCLTCVGQNYQKLSSHPNVNLMMALCPPQCDTRTMQIEHDDQVTFSLLTFLHQMYEKAPRETRTLLYEHESNLKKDLLLNALLSPRALKPCLDLVVENSLRSRLKVLEVNEYGHVCSEVTSLMTSHPQVSVDYTFATSNPSKHDEDDLQARSAQLVRWHLSEDVGVHDLVVLRHFLCHQANVDATLAKMNGAVRDDGFLLVHEITENTLLGHALFGLAADSVTGAHFHNATEWRTILEAHGFQVVAEKREENLCSLFLCKKVGGPYKVTILCVDEPGFKWVNKLKAEVANLKSTDQRLWLVSSKKDSGLLGLTNCLRKEPGGDRIRCTLICDSKQPIHASDWSSTSALMTKLMATDLVMNVRQNGQWGSYRHLSAESDLHSSTVSTQYAYVNVLTRGDLSSLRWIESPLKFFSKSLHPEQDLCDVYYTSLNFRDVMLAAGKLPPDAIPGHMAMQDCILGMEFSGRDSSGRRVMGLLPAKGLATCVDVRRSFLWPVPEHWSLEEAATVPVVYSTVYYALVIRGRIRRGDSVLIHSGSGGVGQAAIAVALRYGCQVYTTVGSNDKRDFINAKFPQLSDRNISNSRDSSFEYDILKSTSGRGVNLVLNSLAEDKLQASLRVLAPHGRFLEIGKVDLSKNSSLGMSLFLKNVTFHGILLDALFEKECSDWDEVSRLVQSGIESGAVQPLRSTIFVRDELEDAFRYMAQGKHIGKVLIKIRDEEPSRLCPASAVSISALPRTICHHEKVYVITGGLGGFGLELADWLIERGAAKLVLTSRTGVRTGYQSQRVRQWREQGVLVNVSTLDITTISQCHEFIDEIIKFGPIGGIFNLAMVLRDAMLEDQSRKTFEEVYQAKVTSTQHLDTVTRLKCSDSLDYFVAFSSIVSGRGNIGQSNYGYANSVLERICEGRRADGLPGLAVQWGAIGDVGAVLNLMGDNYTEIAGTLPQRIYSCLAALDQLLNHPTCAVMSSFVAAERRKAAASGAPGLVSAVANVLGLKDPSSINQEATLADLGLDSLMGVEVKQTLERDFDTTLSIQEIRLLTFSKLHAISKVEELFAATKKKPIIRVKSMEIEDSGVFLRYDPEQLIPNDTIINMNPESTTSSGSRSLFCVHPLEGTIYSLRDLAAAINCPVYGLECTNDAPLDTVGHLAKYYIDAVRRVQAHGPYHLAGYSYGAMVAFEMAVQLEATGDKVEHLILLDGSHSFVNAYTAQHRERLIGRDLAETECQTMSAFIMQFMEIDYKQVSEELLAQANFDSRLKLTARLLESKLSFAEDDVVKAARSFHNKLIAASQYTPSDRFMGDATLVRARDGLEPTKSLGEDYGLEKVCQGSVHIHKVDGNHDTFIRNVQTAEIINGIMQTVN